MINVRKHGYTFDDVLLLPQFSEITSRSLIDLTVTLSKGITLSHPFIPANMQTVTGYEMAEFIAQSGGMAILHRFMPIEDQIKQSAKLCKSGYSAHIGISIGTGKNDYDNILKFIDVGVKIICIDIAHGDSQMCVKMCEYISNNYPQILLIAGNVATAEGAKRLWRAGADVVKSGIGAGSLCSTRIETGNGVPQLTAISDVYQAKLEITGKWFDGQRMTKNELDKEIFVIADGGIKNTGDAVKALCFADLVMIGNMFAATDEAPGDRICQDGIWYKSYVGSSTHKTNRVEGVSALVQLKGSANKVLTTLKEGTQSGLSYQGCYNLIDLKEDPKFIEITSAGIHESRPHSVDHIVK
jgi:IMP dehydrogenase